MSGNGRMTVAVETQRAPDGSSAWVANGSITVCEETIGAYGCAATRMAGELEILKNAVDEPHPNLVAMIRAVRKVTGDVTQLLHDISRSGLEHSDVHAMANNLGREAEALSHRLTSGPLKTLLKEQEKWVAAGFDPALLQSDPEAVHFAVSTRLIHTIAMFKRSADVLDGETADIRNDHGRALFKIEGEWLPYAAFKERIQYSELEWRFIGWNYVHPQGFIPRDWAEYDELYPIAKITPEAYQKVKTHAEQFWSAEQPEIDPGIEKGYVLQVMTTGRDLLPDAWWARNFKEHFPEHTGLRLITPDGLVYSFGTKMRLPDQEFLSHMSSYLGTGISNVPTPDYEEARKCDDRLMTSLPISKQRFDTIIDCVRRANQGICFNFSRQNCVRFGETVLRMGGAEVSVRTSLHELLGYIVPRLSDIPGIGASLSSVATRVSSIVVSVFDAVGLVLGRLLPYPIKKVGEWAVWVATEALRRIEALFWNGVALCLLGGWKTIVPESRLQETNLKEVETFRQLLAWSDLATPDAVPIYYVCKLKEWMKKQRSTLHFLNPDHGFCCFLPERATFHAPLV